MIHFPYGFEIADRKQLIEITSPIS
ncbi:uncharacterized protein METZ01_LOCUS23703 [marine metagenome]|uniref:Uncharacterized protein n=1 Tax=marine metagenome TaxID=408172 RepID=A0A381PXZ7_9ZZZZ